MALWDADGLIPVLRGSGGGEVRWGSPDLRHSTPQFLLISPSASLMLLSHSEEGGQHTGEALV